MRPARRWHNTYISSLQGLLSRHPQVELLSTTLNTPLVLTHSLNQYRIKLKQAQVKSEDYWKPLVKGQSTLQLCPGSWTLKNLETVHNGMGQNN